MIKKIIFTIVMLLTQSVLAVNAGSLGNTGSLDIVAVGDVIDFTGHWVGITVLLVFFVAYVFVIIEEYTDLRKSKPVLLSAGIIWALVAGLYVSNGMPYEANIALQHNLLEYSELFLFLLVAMTYIEVMSERNIFEALKSWLLSRGYGFKKLFWITGILAFFISPLADNLTTALIMGAVVMAVGAGNNKFISIAFVNIIVAANAGGAFSPFGDITTLMVWQADIVKFTEFFVLFIPSVVNYLIPAFIMSFFISGKPSSKISTEKVSIRHGGFLIMGLFLLTIASAVSFHNFLHLPPAMGMMTGLGYLLVAGYFIKRKSKDFDIFDKLANVEWDTLLFFFGVILSVGGLGFLGYLGKVSEFMYVELGATYANVIVGVLSAIVDNIPVMFAVLTMNPDMSHGQWLLVTLTAGVGGSLLSIGSAAGVALMGQARGVYTFVSHLKWAPVISLGYIASIFCHLYINDSLFKI